MGRTLTTNAKGTVATYKPEDGYGFVTTLDVPKYRNTSIDAFFHISDVDADAVEEGWRFEFDLVKTAKGHRAENIEIISRDSHEELGRKKHGLNKDEPISEDTPKNLFRAEELQNRGTDSKDDEEENKKSPFSDDITGDKNDLLK